MTGSTLKLIGLIVPLGLDTLGVALALGIAGLAPALRLQLSLLFAAFEATMPLIGLALGAPLGNAIGGAADYAAAGLIAALGVYTLFFENEPDDDSERLLSMTHASEADLPQHRGSPSGGTETVARACRGIRAKVVAG